MQHGWRRGVPPPGGAKVLYGANRQMQRVEGGTGTEHRSQVPELKGSGKQLDSSCPCHPNLHMGSTRPKGPSPQHG